MSKKTKTVVRSMSNLQHVSKILQSQLISDAKSCDLTDEYTEEKSLIEKLSKSGYHKHDSLTRFEYSDTYAFSFEWKRSGVRVTYINSDGMISAIFFNDQWKSFIKFMEAKLRKIRLEQYVKKEQDEREYEKSEFKKKMYNALREDGYVLQKAEPVTANRSGDDFKEVDGCITLRK
jgi:high-affinity K+ transport system ATPase subunit B